MTDSATAHKPLDVVKARAIAALLDSDQDGEVLNAARALVRLARAAGLRVEALIGGDHQAVIDDQYRAAFRKMLLRVQLKTVGTKLLSAEERQLIFAVLPKATAPTARQAESLLSIARRLGIV